MSIYYRSGFRYQLAKDYTVKLEHVQITGDVVTEFLALYRAESGVWLFIKKDYAWDGPSGPAMDTKSAMRGSLVHDALYQFIRLGKLSDDQRAAADKEYRRICREDGMNAVRAFVHFRALRRFAGYAADAGSERKIEVAP